MACSTTSRDTCARRKSDAATTFAAGEHGVTRRSEFDLIAQVFAPLAAGAPGAFSLTDDAATVVPAAGATLPDWETLRAYTRERLAGFKAKRKISKFFFERNARIVT